MLVPPVTSAAVCTAPPVHFDPSSFLRRRRIRIFFNRKISRCSPVLVPTSPWEIPLQPAAWRRSVEPHQRGSWVRRGPDPVVDPVSVLVRIWSALLFPSSYLFSPMVSFYVTTPHPSETLSTVRPSADHTQLTLATGGTQ